MTASATKSSSTTRSKKTRISSAERRARLAPRLARDVAIDTATRSVPDPYEPGSFLTATLNRRVDILAQERAAGRIDEAQFLVGRMIQAVFERGSGARLGSGGWGQGGSRDQTIAHELQIIFAIEDAEKVRKFTRRLEDAIGAVGVRFLRAILAEGKTFATYASDRGRGGERAATDVAKRFRWLLESLTEEQHTATGRHVPLPRDQYLAAADQLPERIIRLKEVEA
ncbi:hypothetical protein [Methylobacterium oxalidis]|uniref:Uncharacterized protein n=1 Tax=Methylobacterium oxalidis TaxID=944322 RepID=A0A512JDA9_9HYPH|nr:hypothetical protein [Methylobacterium oxalidis]GEP07925.1 hypothetical protein MOX02_59630 [Methylobacterium oxalidis]GLS66141.1 hypothetical protein GCM10007888_45230 [Methylobacterium oxalidis]